MCVVYGKRVDGWVVHVYMLYEYAVFESVCADVPLGVLQCSTLDSSAAVRTCVVRHREVSLSLIKT